MTNYTEQINRIKDKLVDAKKADKSLKVFGAERHKYVVKESTTLQAVKAFEKKYSIELPDCYKAFILEVGNGGIGFQNSAAGPYYGIYPFGENINELVYENVEKYLKQECVIVPKMTDEFWESLIKIIEAKENILDEDYDTALGNLWAGILPIGSQGCTYLHGIILNGPFKGRVVNLDIDRQKPQFAYERNFLDWYERWLDEVISGDLIKKKPSWFGYSKGGTEEELMASLIASKDIEEKNENLNGLLDKKKLSEKSLKQLEYLINTNFEPKKTLIQLLCKSNYEKAKPYLIALCPTDLLFVFQTIFWYAKEKSEEWTTIIQENIHKIDNEETFIFCTYVLMETNSNISNLILPFTKNSNEKIRTHAFYTLDQLKDKKYYLSYFTKIVKLISKLKH